MNLKKKNIVDAPRSGEGPKKQRILCLSPARKKKKKRKKGQKKTKKKNKAK